MSLWVAESLWVLISCLIMSLVADDDSKCHTWWVITVSSESTTHIYLKRDHYTALWAVQRPWHNSTQLVGMW